ncbi:MAG: RNA polymerase sigma factor [Clostridia bacterium]|nr:RNA polymerase sigma factor [Clostridia bacterium]
MAEDASQETFLRAWKSMAQFEGRNNAAPKSWLIRIAINTCKNIRRTAWFRKTDRSVTPEELPLPAQEEDRTLLMTVQALPDKQREVVILRYYHGMSLDEAARTLGLSRSTAFHRLQKALKRLRIQWEGGTENE